MGYEPSEVEVAWAAGLFEGEGTFTYLPSSRRRQVRIGMTDKDVLERFQLAVGVGRVYGPYRVREGRKPMYDWAVQDWEGVTHVIGLLWPFLSARRRTAAQVLLDHPPKQTNAAKTHCPQGHPYSDENVVTVSGTRRCRICKSETYKRWYDRQKAVA